jgi:FdhE protein
MSKVDALRHDPVPIGEVAAPPFVRLPDPLTIFVQRTHRLRALGRSGELAPYLLFLARLTELQYRIQDELPAPELPDAGAIARAREFALPPLDRNRFTADLAFETTLDRLLSAAQDIEMPPAARAALARVCDGAQARDTMVRALLADAVPIEALAEHVFIAAALQVHFARLAAGLDAKALVPVGDGVCPSCGGPPVSTMVVGWPGARDTRFCACALCGTLWHAVRIKCVLCGSTKGIRYQEVDGGEGNATAGTVKAETCDECHGYVKLLQQNKDPDVDPIADDVASLGLDLLVRELGFRRGAFNPFLLGY